MKEFFQGIAMVAGAIWILLTDKEQARQYDYDRGCGEVE